MPQDRYSSMSQNLREISAAPIMSAKATPDANPQERLWGYVFAALGTLLFSMKAIFVKLAYLPGGGLQPGDLEPITLMMLRMGFSLPIYILIGIIVYRRRAADTPPIGAKLILSTLAVGCLGYYVCAFLDFTGLQFITAQLERLLLFTYPGFVVILGAMFFGVAVTRISLACIALAYFGLLVIFVGGDIATGSHLLLGSALLITCAICFALFQLFAKPIISQMGALLFTCVSMCAASLGVFLHFAISNGGPAGMAQALSLPPRIFALGAAIAVFSTLLASFAVNLALGRIGAQATATIGMLSPVAVIVAAVTLLGEPFGWVDAFGTALTILGIGLYTWFDRRAKQPN